MAKETLSEDEYLAELNRRLKGQERYIDGMAFIPYPDGAKGREMSGYTVTGPFTLMGVYAQVAHSVESDFELKT